MLSDVLISLASQQIDADGESSGMSLTMEGKYYEKAGYKYITYKETRLTGMEGTTTLIKIESDRVSVIRMGSVEAKQVFMEGKRYLSNYITSFGTFQMAVIPWTVEVFIQGGEGRIHLEYDLEIDDQPFSRNSMVIEVRRLYGYERKVDKNNKASGGECS